MTSAIDALKPYTTERRVEETAAAVARAMTLAWQHGSQADGLYGNALQDLASAIETALSDFNAEVESIEDREANAPSDQFGRNPYDLPRTHPGAR